MKQLLDYQAFLTFGMNLHYTFNLEHPQVLSLKCRFDTLHSRHSNMVMAQHIQMPYVGTFKWLFTTLYFSFGTSSLSNAPSLSLLQPCESLVQSTNKKWTTHCEVKSIRKINDLGKVWPLFTNLFLKTLLILNLIDTIDLKGLFRDNHWHYQTNQTRFGWFF